MKKLFSLFILLCFIASLSSPVFGSNERKGWYTLADNTQAYGYWTEVAGNQILVECNVNSGKETGYAFLNSGHYETVQKEIVDHYEYVKKEDFSEVTKLHPVTVKQVLAPNMPTEFDIDMDYYHETGQIRYENTDNVTWPGDDFTRIAPGVNSQYWLIVAEVKNPNPFPVKALVDITLGTSSNIHAREEIMFQANETRFVKLNDGTLSKLYASLPTTKKTGWSEERHFTSIVENHDPELPDTLKPNFGWYDNTNYAGGDGVLNLSDPNELTSNMRYTFYISYRGYPSWIMEGYLAYTQNGWEVQSTYCSKPELQEQAKTIILDWARSKNLNFPRVYTDDLTDGNFVFFRFYGYGAALGTAGKGADRITGPVILGYDSSKKTPYEYESNYSSRAEYRLDSPNIAGWADDYLPVVIQEPLFLTQYEFVPQESPNVGILKKVTKPGLYIKSDTIERPQFEMETNLVSWSKETLVPGTKPTVRYSFTYDVKIDGVNDSDYGCIFKTQYGSQNIKFNLSKIKYLKNFIQTHNKVLSKTESGDDYYYYQEPVVSDPNYYEADTGVKSISLPPNTRTTVFSQRRTVSFDIQVYNSSNLDEAHFIPFLNDSREAIFLRDISNEKYVFEMNSDRILGLALIDMRYRSYSYYKDDYEDNYSLSTFGNDNGIKDLSNLSEGMSMFASDEFYPLFLKSANRNKMSFPDIDTQNLWATSTKAANVTDNPGTTPGLKDLDYSSTFLPYAASWKQTYIWIDNR